MIGARRWRVRGLGEATYTEARGPTAVSGVAHVRCLTEVGLRRLHQSRAGAGHPPLHARGRGDQVRRDHPADKLRGNCDCRQWRRRRVQMRTASRGSINHAFCEHSPRTLASHRRGGRPIPVAPTQERRACFRPIPTSPTRRSGILTGRKFSREKRRLVENSTQRHEKGHTLDLEADAPSAPSAGFTPSKTRRTDGFVRCTSPPRRRRAALHANAGPPLIGIDLGRCFSSSEVQCLVLPPRPSRPEPFTFRLLTALRVRKAGTTTTGRRCHGRDLGTQMPSIISSNHTAKFSGDASCGSPEIALSSHRRIRMSPSTRFGSSRRIVPSSTITDSA